MIRILLLFINIILINVAFLLSFLIRYGTDIPQVNFQPYKENFAFLSLMYMIAFVVEKVFKNRFTSFWELFKNLFTALFIGTFFSISLVYVFRSQWSKFPSSVFLISFPVGVCLIFICNGFILKATGKIKKKVIIIGRENIADVLDKRSFIESHHIDRIEDLLKFGDIDEVVICKRISDDKQLNLLIYLLLKLKVNVVFNPLIYAELLSASILEKNSVRFLATFMGRKSDCEEFLIRAFDTTISLLALFLLVPLIAVVSLIIKLTSSGPVFYKQTRVAKDGKTFTLYKFKTMVNNAEKHTGPVLATENDPRVTRIGRFLRTSRIDEIPQLFNVMRGDMSLVGPRPERPHFVKRHKALREIRLAVKPGLTGLAQIRNAYDLHPRHKLKYDYLYIQRRSLLLNLYILMKTIPVVLRKKGR